MEFTIKDEYVDLRAANPDIARAEAAAGNPFAVLQLVFLQLDRYNHDIPTGINLAFETISSFDWRSHAVTTACYWNLFNVVSKLPKEQKLKEFKKVITPQFVEALAQNADNSYYSRYYAGIFIGSGHGPLPKGRAALQIFSRAQSLIEPLATPNIQTLEDTRKSGNAAARVALQAVLVATAQNQPGLSRNAKNALYEKAGLLLLAAARSGHRLAQATVGMNIVTPNKDEPFFANLTDQAQRFAIAEECLKAAIEQGYAESRFYLACLYRGAGRLEDAVPLYRTAPDHDNIASLALAEALKKMGRTDEAKELYQRLAEPKGTSLGDKRAISFLAELHHELGEYEDAYNRYVELLQRTEGDGVRPDVFLRVAEYNDKGLSAASSKVNALITAESALMLSSRGRLRLGDTERTSLGEIRRRLRPRALMVDSNLGLRRLQNSDQIPTPNKERIFIFPETPSEFIAAIESEMMNSGIKISMKLASELAGLLIDQPEKARRWHVYAGERGSAQDMQIAIESFFTGESGLERNWIEALRLCRLALREQKRGGVPLGKTRDAITAIKAELMGENSANGTRIWVGIPPHPVSDKDEKLDDAIIVPENPEEAVVWYLRAAGQGSADATRIVANHYLSQPDTADKVWIYDATGTLRRAQEGDDLSQSLLGDLSEQAAAQAQATIASGIPSELPSQESSIVEQDVAFIPENDPDAELNVHLAAADGGSIEDALHAAMIYYERGQPEEAFDIYFSLVQQGYVPAMEVAERLASIKPGGIENLDLAYDLYIQLRAQIDEYRDEFPENAESRVASIYEKLLDDAWVFDDGGRLCKVHGGEENITIDDARPLHFYMDTSENLRKLQDHQYRSFDAAAEVATRLANGGPDRPADYLAAFRLLSDLLLDRKIYAPQDRHSHVLPIDSPQRKRLKDLWNKVALRVEAAGMDDHGNEEYCTPNHLTQASVFVVQAGSVKQFRQLIAHGRLDGLRT